MSDVTRRGLLNVFAKYVAMVMDTGYFVPTALPVIVVLHNNETRHVRLSDSAGQGERGQGRHYCIVGCGAFFVTYVILSHADHQQDFSSISLISAYIPNVTEYGARA